MPNLIIFTITEHTYDLVSSLNNTTYYMLETKAEETLDETFKAVANTSTVLRDHVISVQLANAEEQENPPSDYEQPRALLLFCEFNEYDMIYEKYLSKDPRYVTQENAYNRISSGIYELTTKPTLDCIAAVYDISDINAQNKVFPSPSPGIPAVYFAESYFSRLEGDNQRQDILAKLTDWCLNYMSFYLANKDATHVRCFILNREGKMAYRQSELPNILNNNETALYLKTESMFTTLLQIFLEQSRINARASSSVPAATMFFDNPISSSYRQPSATRRIRLTSDELSDIIGDDPISLEALADLPTTDIGFTMGGHHYDTKLLEKHWQNTSTELSPCTRQKTEVFATGHLRFMRIKDEVETMGAFNITHLHTKKDDFFQDPVIDKNGITYEKAEAVRKNIPHIADIIMKSLTTFAKQKIEPLASDEEDLPVASQFY